MVLLRIPDVGTDVLITLNNPSSTVSMYLIFLTKFIFHISFGLHYINILENSKQKYDVIFGYVAI